MVKYYIGFEDSWLAKHSTSTLAFYVLFRIHLSVENKCAKKLTLLIFNIELDCCLSGCGTILKDGKILAVSSKVEELFLCMRVMQHSLNSSIFSFQSLKARNR